MNMETTKLIEDLQHQDHVFKLTRGGSPIASEMVTIKLSPLHPIKELLIVVRGLESDHGPNAIWDMERGSDQVSITKQRKRAHKAFSANQEIELHG